jgi:hypothetical protein
VRHKAHTDLKETGMKKRIAAIGAGLVAGAAVIAGAPGASAADNCRESLWGDDIFGNKRYSCSDGSYTLKKPFYSDRWDDPFTTYEFEGDSNSWSGKCSYSSFRNGYDCTGGYKDRYGYNSYGSDSYGYNSFNDPYGW